MFHTALAATVAALSILVPVTSLAATPYANATVGGALSPGVYGRIEIGTAPPPPLIYAQPLIIQRVPIDVQQPPLYLHVPPGHAKKWSKHCARYNACGQPVYFVRVQGDEDYERGKYKDYHQGKDKDKDKDKGHRKGRDKDRGDD